MISMLLVRVAGFEPAAASEEARSVLFPRFAEEPRKLHIRRLLPSLKTGPAPLGSGFIWSGTGVFADHINKKPGRKVWFFCGCICSHGDLKGGS
jgi:hypothetical protein